MVQPYNLTEILNFDTPSYREGGRKSGSPRPSGPGAEIYY